MRKRGEESKLINRIMGFVVLVLLDSLDSKIVCL